MFRGPGYPITSTGLVNCLGLEQSAVLKRLDATESGLARRRLFENFAPRPYEGVVGAAEVQPFTTLSAAQRPRQALLARAAMLQVQKSTAAACERWGNDRVGLILGTSTGGIAASEKAFVAYRRAQVIPDDYSFEKQHAFDGVAHLLARELDVQGPTYVVSTACSSSSKALAAAGRLLAEGVCDAVLVGGVDSLCLTTLLGFESLGLIDPEGCRPFAAHRRGISIGEGAAFLLLEREAATDVFLTSVGETSDAHHMAHPHPEGIGAESAMLQALEQAGVAPDRVQYVNAHGTGTLLNDDIEARAILRVFGTRPPVSSTKAATGHLLGACGATEAVFCSHAIQAGRVPGNGEHAPSGLGLEIPERTLPRSVDVVLSNSLAFGGSNASVLLASRAAYETMAESKRSSAGAPRALQAELTHAVVWPQSLAGSGLAAQGPSAVDDIPKLLGGRSRGRASSLTLMFTELLEELAAIGFSAGTSPIIYGSAYGEMATTMQLLELQTDTGQSSPLRFQVSVHNTAAGLLSIATGNRKFSNSVAAGRSTFAMAMLEGIAYLHHSGENEVAVLVADEASVSPLSRTQHGPFAAGFRLSRADTQTREQRCLITAPRSRTSSVSLSRAADELEESVSRNPVADAYRLYRAFHARRAGSVALGAVEPDASSKASRVWSLDLDFG